MRPSRSDPDAFWDLAFLTDHWPDLLESRLVGTPRPWRTPTLTPAARSANDQRAKAERADRTDLAIGEHPAPMHVDVTDVIVDLVATADDLAERLAQSAGADRLPPASSAYADPRPHLDWCRKLWTDVEDKPLLDYAARELKRLVNSVTLTLRLVRDGQQLYAVCPWCHGGIIGCPTMRVRETFSGTLVVCYGVNCNPPTSECGTWWKGRPAWPQHEWDWLATRLEVVA